MKDGLKTRYFEDIIQRCYLDNPHKVLLTMRPSTTMAAEREAAQAKELADKKAAMSAEDIQRVIEQTAQLKEEQQRPETPEALATIPVLQRSDIRKEADPVVLEEREAAGCKVLFSDINTSGIGYVQMFFDAHGVAQEDLPYAYLLADLLGAVDTAQRGYADLANQENLSTGGIDYHLISYVKNGTPDDWLPLFRVKAKALMAKLPRMFELAAEILTESRFTDRKRMRELLLQCRAGAEMDIQRTPHAMMFVRLASYLTDCGQFEDVGALQYYWFVRDITDHFDEKFDAVAKKLADLLTLLFRRGGLTVSFTGKEEDYEVFAKEFEAFAKKLPEGKAAAVEWHWQPENRKEGLSTASQVQYVGKAANFIKLGYEFRGSMRVLENLLRYDYFWTKIRVQGGAYGAMTRFSRAGTLLFASYRDPNLTETMDVFNGTADYAANYEASEREMNKAVIGTMSGIDAPLTPQMKGNQAVACYFQNVKDADRQKVRDEILGVTQQDIRDLAPVIRDAMALDTFCVIGNEAKLKEHEAVFRKIVPVME